MISLHDAVAKIQGTKWTFTNNFEVQLLFDSGNTLASRCGLDTMGSDINLYIKDVAIPQIGTSTLIEKFTLDRPRIAMGAWECTTFDFTFKDFDNLGLYKRFVAYVAGERDTYFDEYKFKVKVIKLGDHVGDASEQHVLTLDNCYITTVSQVTLSNEHDSQVLEFGVQIKSASLESVEGFLSSESSLMKATAPEKAKPQNTQNAQNPPATSNTDISDKKGTLEAAQITKPR